MKNKQLFNNIEYEGYYDETNKENIDITKENAEKLLSELTETQVNIKE